MKHMRRFTALVLALVMVFSLTAPASAAEKVTVKLSPNITVKLDGEPQAMTDVKGNPVYPVLYGGTTYLPVRAVGNMLGLDVDWDQATQTVLLTTSDSKASSTGSKAPANAKPTDITVSINPSITVKLDGETQKMTNVNGDPVYPMLYGGTTYLPVRAVSNMLMVDVDWDGATQTVILDNSFGTLTVDDDGNAVVVGTTYEQLYRTLKHFQVPQDIISSRLTTQIKESSDRFKAIGATPTLTVELGNQSYLETPKTLGKDHIGYTWVELDYSTANEGYICVKVNERIVSGIRCELRWFDENGEKHMYAWRYAPTEQWAKIPLIGGSADYTVEISQTFGPKEGAMSGEELSKLCRQDLGAKFTAKIDTPDNLWLQSNVKVDYENAPSAVAKAKELTKNCKTDAEKITAIYNFASKALTYDHALIAQQDAEEGTGYRSVRDLNPDHILASGKGVCEHYAVLMTAMLRSIGISCKLVSGFVLSDEGTEEPHAWVAVKPETGTLNISGMGTDYTSTEWDEYLNKVPANPTGWIRLDPTNAKYPSFTANDNIYYTEMYQ